MNKRQTMAMMDWVLERSGWPLLKCKICGRTVGRYPPNDKRIDRDRCLTCIIMNRTVKSD